MRSGSDANPPKLLIVGMWQLVPLDWGCSWPLPALLLHYCDKEPVTGNCEGVCVDWDKWVLSSAWRSKIFQHLLECLKSTLLLSFFFFNLLHFVFTSFNTVRGGDAQLQLLSSADVLYEFGSIQHVFVIFTTNSTEEIPLCAFILFPVGFFNLICFMVVGAVAVCIYLRMWFRAFLSLVFAELCCASKRVHWPELDVFCLCPWENAAARSALALTNPCPSWVELN